MNGYSETDDRQIILGNLAALLFAGGVKNLVHSEDYVLESGEPREQTGRLPFEFRRNSITSRRISLKRRS